MAKKEKVTASSDQRPPKKADLGNKITTVILSEEDQERSLGIQRVGMAVPVLAVLGSIVYLIVFFATQSWAMLAAAVMNFIGGAVFFMARNVARNNRINRAAYIVIGMTLVLLPSYTLTWSNSAMFLGVGTAGFVIIMARLMLPRKHVPWVGLVSVFVGIGLAFLFDRIAPWSRFDITEIPILRVFTYFLLGGGVVVAIWQVILAFRIGSIRTRMIIAFALLLLPMTAITIISAVLSYQQGQEQAVNQLESVVALRESQVDKWVSEIQIALSSAARWRETRHQGETVSHGMAEFLEVLTQEPLTSASYQDAYGRLQNDLDRILEQTPQFEVLLLMDRDGQVLLSTDIRREDENYADQAYFQRGLQGAYLQPLSYSTSMGRGQVTAAYPVVDSRGQTLGVLAGIAGMDVLNEFMSERTGLGETGEAYLIDTNYMLLTNTSFADRYARAVEGPQIAIGSQTNGFAWYDDARGTSVIGVYHWLPKLHVALVAEQGWTEAQGLMLTMLIIDAVVALVFVSIAAIAWVVIDRGINNPLDNLIETAARIAAGELDRSARVEREDEIGAMAHAFNDMTVRMRDLIRSLRDRTDALEARTREIEASQRVTFAASARSNPDDLLNLVVNLMRDQFHLYHVQVYIVDEEQQAAVLRQSTGYAGRQLLQRAHQIPLSNVSLVTQAIVEGEPTVVDDVTQAPGFMRNPLLPDTMSELVVPLKTGERVIGALDVQSRTVGRFPPNIMTLFQTMADQVTFLFENSDLLARVTEQTEILTVFTDQLRTSADIARRLTTILDPDQLLQRVVELIRSRYGLYHVHIYRVDDSMVAEGRGGERLIVRAGSGDVGRVLREQQHYIPLDSEKSLAARAVRGKESTQVDDTAIDSNYLPNPLLPQTRSELAVPLIVGDRVLGVLDVQDDQPDRFSQSERDTLNTLAGQIATALQTAGLFEESQARLRVSQTLAGTQTEEQVLDAMMQAAALQPRALCAIYMFDQETEELDATVRRSDPFESGVVDVLSAGTRLLESQSTLFQHITSGDSFVTTNFALDVRTDTADRSLAKMQGLVSMALVPIMLGDQLLGVVAAASRIEGYFDDRQLHLYQSLAEQGAVTLRTGRFYDELQRTFEQLRELDRLKSEFLSNMSHELRTPLNSIIGYTEIMLLGIDGELDPETAEDVEAIHSNGRHLLRLINDVLDMAKLDAGRLLLNIEENHLDLLLEDARDGVAKLLADKPIEMIVEVEDDLPPVEGDRMRLAQILRNIVTNAGQFTEKGTITLRAYAAPDSGGDRVCIAIEDTGPGISEANMATIFDRFQQVDGSQTRVVGGTGLGLSITQQLVNMHGGAIEVQSKVGVGSTFTVCLPVRQAA